MNSTEAIKKYIQALHAETGKQYCFIDFEFNNSQEKKLNLVCCSWLCSSHITTQEIDQEAYTPMEIWLRDSDFEKQVLRNVLIKMRQHKIVIVAYGAVAEARSFLSLDEDPHYYPWIDLYAEWRQLTYNNNTCSYGVYFKGGYKRRSVPPKFNTTFNRGKDNKAVGMSMVAAIAQMFEIDIDSEYKTQMRDLILLNKPSYTVEEKKEIMHYCTTDILYLPAMLYEMTIRLKRVIGFEVQDIHKIQTRRGMYCVSIAKNEYEGVPINRKRIEALRHNFASAEDKIITNLVENYYPFYAREKDKEHRLVGRWVDKYDNFVSLVKGKNLYDEWPRTIDKKTKRYTQTLARDNDTLEKYDGVPEIYAYRQAKKAVKNLAWFKAPNAKQLAEDGDFFDSVGSDDCVRSFLGPFGAHTSRNAPKAKRFIFAMSKWLRCLVQAARGWVILALDYSAQEFAIAAVMSGDPEMLAAYRSGDPYLYFAMKAGAVPLDANQRWCKHPKEAPAELQSLYQAYKRQRTLFKSTALGLQYGMGVVNLAIKLTTDMGEIITEQEAKKLVGLHKALYWQYWIWLDGIEKQYKRNGVLHLWDGWAIMPDNDNMLSVKNAPIQGTGGVILREMTRLAHEKGAKQIAPLHDAGYFKVRKENTVQATAVLKQLFQQAFYNVLGNALEIRVDVEVHEPEKDWIADGGEEFFELLHKYLEPMDNKEDEHEKMIGSIYAR